MFVCMQLLHGELGREDVGPAEGRLPQQLHGLLGQDQRHSEPIGSTLPTVSAPGTSNSQPLRIARKNKHILSNAGSSCNSSLQVKLMCSNERKVQINHIMAEYMK